MAVEAFPVSKSHPAFPDARFAKEPEPSAIESSTLAVAVQPIAAALVAVAISVAETNTGESNPNATKVESIACAALLPYAEEDLL